MSAGRRGGAEVRRGFGAAGLTGGRVVLVAGWEPMPPEGGKDAAQVAGADCDRRMTLERTVDVRCDALDVA